MFRGNSPSPQIMQIKAKSGSAQQQVSTVAGQSLCDFHVTAEMTTDFYHIKIFQQIDKITSTQVETKQGGDHQRLHSLYDPKFFTSNFTSNFTYTVYY